MEFKNGGFVADDQEMHDSSQVHGMISEIDQSQKTGVYKPNIWKYDRIEALRTEHAVRIYLFILVNIDTFFTWFIGIQLENRLLFLIKPV